MNSMSESYACVTGLHFDCCGGCSCYCTASDVIELIEGGLIAQ